MINKEDYEEPRCPLCNDLWVKDKIVSIPIDRVLSKQDEYLSRNDYEGAEKHLKYWLGEAEIGRDLKGKLLLFNELMGLYRKLGRGKEAVEYAESALELVDVMNVSQQVAGGTAFLNSATVFKAFGMPEKSIILFEKAKAIYEKELNETDPKLAGLYNNMALTLVDLKRYEDARLFYKKALFIMQGIKDGEPDRAITYLNMADAAEAEFGSEGAEKYVEEYIEKAWELLSNTQKQDGYYAFVCDKCAPVFEYYGYFIYKKKLAERAKEIYERD